MAKPSNDNLIPVDPTPTDMIAHPDPARDPTTEASQKKGNRMPDNAPARANPDPLSNIRHGRR